MKLFPTVGPALIGFALAFVLRIINRTLRWEKQGFPEGEVHWSEDRPLILTFWHGDQLMMPWAYLTNKKPSSKPSMNTLVSLHGDGQIAGYTLKNLSINCVDGSSSKGGARALMVMRRILRQGNHVCITPDGPKGPKHEAKVGVALLSSLSGVPILPVAVATSASWKIGSWDGMFIPKPFSKAVMIASELVFIPPDLSREQLMEKSKEIELELNSLKSQANQLCQGN